MADADYKITTLVSTVTQLAGALVSTRKVLAYLMYQPNLLLSQKDRDELSKLFAEGSDRLDKTMDAIEDLMAQLRGQHD